MIDPAKKVLKIVYKDLLRESPVCVDTPVCHNCGKTIEVMDENVDVEFLDIKVGNNTLTLIEPICPACGTRVPAKYNLVH